MLCTSVKRGVQPECILDRNFTRSDAVGCYLRRMIPHENGFHVHAGECDVM
jgi:hypothetical protein